MLSSRATRSSVAEVGRSGEACWSARSRIAAEQMHVTCFFRSWLSWKYADQGWLSLHQALQGGLHIRQFGELEDSLAARSQFARSLGSTKQQRAHHRRLSAGEIENLLQAMFVLGDAALGAAHRAGQILRVQRIESISDSTFVEIHHWIAIRFLITCIDQRIQRQGIVVRGSALFFSQGAEHASFNISQYEFH